MQDVTVEADMLVASIRQPALGAPSIGASGDLHDLGGTSIRRFRSSCAYATPADRSVSTLARASTMADFTEAVAAAVKRRAAV